MAFSKKGLLVATDRQLSATAVTPHVQQRILSGQNLLWCGTFQLAWNETAGLIGEELHFAPEPPMVAELNRGAFTRDDLDAESYGALAGFVGDGIFGKIDRALAETFKGQARPHYLPPRELTPRPQDIVAYCYLFKHMEFAVPFEDLPAPLRFAGADVASFGMREYKTGHRPMYDQVRILDYRDEDDFVIEVLTKSKGDRLILAKTAPAETLAGAIADVQGRIRADSVAAMSAADVLVVPKFNFDVTREYRELLGLHLVAKNPAVAEDLLILAALQNIRFQMDEKGVRLRSESHISLGCSAAATPVPEHVMIFDKPFLVLMQRADRTLPYFALWVDNAELMVKR